MAEWLGCWTSSPWVPGSNPTLSTSWIWQSRVINPSAALVNSQLVCLPPVGIFKTCYVSFTIFVSFVYYSIH